MLLDEDFIILLKPDGHSKVFVHTRATVVIKVKHKSIVETLIDKKDPRVVVLAILDEKNPAGYSEKRIVFEDWRKAYEIKDQHLDMAKVRQMEGEKSAIEAFIKDCENDIASLSK